MLDNRQDRRTRAYRRYRIASAATTCVCLIFWTLVCIAAATITACLTG